MRRINLDDFKEYIKKAKKSGLVFCKNTVYYGLFKNEEMIGFTGILPYSNKFVFKNSFVLEKHRGKGYHKKMMDYRIKLAKLSGVKIIEATCTNMSLNNYLKYDFKIIKEYKLYTKVRKHI